MDWTSLRAAKEAGLQQRATTPLSEVTPSIRDFAHFVTTYKSRSQPPFRRSNASIRIALNPGLSWMWLRSLKHVMTPKSGQSVCIPNRVCSARRVMICERFRIESPPRYSPLDLVLHESQIHQARLCGADAILLWAGAVDTPTLGRLILTASSLHVVPVVMAQTPDELHRRWRLRFLSSVLPLPAGHLTPRTSQLLPRKSRPQKTIISLDELTTAEEAGTLLGMVDAAGGE